MTRAWARLLPLGTAALAIVLAWAALSQAMRNPMLLPSPLVVVETLAALVASGSGGGHSAGDRPGGDRGRPRDVTSAEFNRVQREVMDLHRPELRQDAAR